MRIIELEKPETAASEKFQDNSESKKAGETIVGEKPEDNNVSKTIPAHLGGKHASLMDTPMTSSSMKIGLETKKVTITIPHPIFHKTVKIKSALKRNTNTLKRLHGKKVAWKKLEGKITYKNNISYKCKNSINVTLTI